jgi:hypothetical protein
VVVVQDSSSVVPVAHTNRDSFIPSPHEWRNSLKDCTSYVKRVNEYILKESHRLPFQN